MAARRSLRPAGVTGTSSSVPVLRADGLGNLYETDGPYPLVREFQMGNVFPATPLSTSVTPAPVTQPIQIHFDLSNPPVIGAAATVGTNVFTTTSFSIAPGNGDFTIDTTTPEFAMGTLGTGGYGNSVTNLLNWNMHFPTPNPCYRVGLPTCYQFGASSTGLPIAIGSSTPLLDKSYDCLVYVKFNPTAPGMRQGQLVATILRIDLQVNLRLRHQNGGQPGNWMQETIYLRHLRNVALAWATPYRHRGGTVGDGVYCGPSQQPGGVLPSGYGAVRGPDGCGIGLKEPDGRGGGFGGERIYRRYRQ